MQLIYSESLSVVSESKFVRHVRVAYKILRPGGRDYGMLYTAFTPRRKVTSLRGWCIPVQAKDYEVTEKDAIQANGDPSLDAHQ